MYNLWERIKYTFVKVFSNRLFVLIAVFCMMFSILIIRLFNLQIVNGQKYQDNYKLQIQKTRVLQGTRGNIYDRNGKLLAYNELAYSVTIEDNGSSVFTDDEELNKEIQHIIALVEANGDSVINDFNIVLDMNNNYQFAMENETLRLRFIADVFGKKTIDLLSDKQASMSAPEIIDYLCTDEIYGYGIDQSAMEKEEVLKLVNVRYAIGLNSFRKYIPTTVAEDVCEETVASIMENMDSLAGVDIAEESLRRYADSKYFANIIGYTGQISQDEYDSLSKAEQKKYSLTDTVGKSGLEREMDTFLQGEKGEVKLYVNSVGKVIETAETIDAKAGNNLYLTIDADLQKAAYDILEQELAGILLAKMADILDYDRSVITDAGDVVVASGDVYYSFIGNDILDTSHFKELDSGTAEKRIYKTFSEYKEHVLNNIESTLHNPSATQYTELPREYQAYQSYVVNDLLTTNTGVLMAEAIDKNDETYKKWRYDETININTYLNYAISQNWINASKLQDYIETNTKYSDADELYEALIDMIIDSLKENRSFDKLIYKYMIKEGTITGKDICLAIYEQEVLEYDAAQYNNLDSGKVLPYDFIRGKIETLDITPGQLGLEPCTGSMVITDTKTGDVLACVSYPGYDNNRLANTMDSVYYNQLVTNLSRPFYNNATQEKTAPGSTYKPLSAIAGLTEGVFDTETIVYCDGEYDRVSPSIKCWVHPDMHGSQDVVSALTNSCNVYFCDLGFNLSLEEVGIKPNKNTNNSEDEYSEIEEIEDEDGDKVKQMYSSETGLSVLRKYATMFGLNETSGLELPESDPQISDDSSVPSTMGQGTNNFTTSQLARYVTAVANRGTVYDLTLLDHIEKVDGTIIETFDAEVKNEITEIDVTTWNAVHAGMRGVVSNSSVFDKLNACDVLVSGKTGTAQQSTTHPDHGLFVGFAPSNSPEIAFAVRIANGYSSTFASEVGKGVLEYYYQITKPEDLITGTAAKITVSAHSD